MLGCDYLDSASLLCGGGISVCNTAREHTHNNNVDFFFFFFFWKYLCTALANPLYVLFFFPTGCSIIIITVLFYDLIAFIKIIVFVWWRWRFNLRFDERFRRFPSFLHCSCAVLPFKCLHFTVHTYNLYIFRTVMCFCGRFPCGRPNGDDDERRGG